MSELKPGWKRVKFGQMASCINDRVDNPSEAGVERYVGLEHLDPENLCIRRWGAPEEVESTKLRFRSGDIIFGKRRAYQRKLAVADFDGICSAHAMVLRAKPSIVIRDFLPFFMQSDFFMERAIAISVGSLSPTINWRVLAEEVFPLPPLEEQIKIMTVAAPLAELIYRYEVAIHEGQGVTTSLRNYLMSTKTIDRKDYSLESLSIGRYGIVDGPFGSNLTRRHFRATGHPIIKSSFIVSGMFAADRDKYDYVDDDTYNKLRRNQVYPGDILVALIGANCGASAILPHDHKPGIISQNCLKITVNQDLCSQKYMLQHLKWLNESGRLVSHISSTAQPALSLGRMRGIPIALPNLITQSKIESDIDFAERSVTDLINRLNNIKLTHKLIFLELFGQVL